MSLFPPPSVPRGEARPPLPFWRRRKLLISGISVLLILLVVAGLLSQHLLSSGRCSQATPLPSGNGPYVRLPLTAQQIYDLEHLSQHMQYKALASLYVDHM